MALLLFVPLACSDSDEGGAGGAQGSDGGPGSAGGSGGSASALQDGHPSWLAGASWTKGYKIENNIAFESEDSGLRLGGSPDFVAEIKVGKSWVKQGTWNVSSGAIVLGSETIPIKDALQASCRLLKTSSRGSLHASSDVAGCPFATPPTPAECAKVGTYKKTSGSGSNFEQSTTYRLETGGLLQYETGSFQTTCYGNTCKYLYNTSAPRLSVWSLSGSSVLSDGAPLDLTGFDFTAAGCGTAPGPSGSAAAAPPSRDGGQ